LARYPDPPDDKSTKQRRINPAYGRCLPYQPGSPGVVFSPGCLRPGGLAMRLTDLTEMKHTLFKTDMKCLEQPSFQALFLFEVTFSRKETAVCHFSPFSSRVMIDRDLFLISKEEK
jgi:hypothetical protein